MSTAVTSVVKIATVLICAILSLIMDTLPGVAASGDSLGISVQVELASGKNATNLNDNNKLWFVINPGGVGERSFMVRSTSGVAQRIHLGVVARNQVNGELQLDPEGETVVSNWTQFSPNDFVLAPHAVKRVVMKLSIPEDAEIASYQPSLLVQASSAKNVKSQYSVPTGLQFAQGMFVGVGTSEQMPISFKIERVYGQNSVSGKQVVIDFRNTGKTPLALVGKIQFSSAEFSGLSVGPLGFITQTIEPGDLMHATLAAPENLIEGNWNVFVEASQGEIKETKTFTNLNISYRGVDVMAMLLWAIGIVFASALIGLISYRTLRSIRSKEKREREAAEAAEAERLEERAKLATLEAELAKLKAKPRAKKKVEKTVVKPTKPKKPKA